MPTLPTARSIASSPRTALASSTTAWMGAALAGALFTACAAQADTVARNATELRDALRGNTPAAVLEPLKTEGWCGPQGCFVDAGELRIDRDKGGFARAEGGRKLQVVEHKAQGGDALPDLDWTPTDAYRVMAGGQRWGSCLEFSHAGVGKSGTFQRWTSVVLVPFDGAAPGKTAHRFVGYWTGCDSLVTGATTGTLSLRVVERSEPKADKPLRLMAYQCSARGCEGQVDRRAVSGEPGNAQDGTLTIGQP